MKVFFLRLINMTVGLIFYAFGIVLLIQANIGYAPWEVFHVGLAEVTGLGIGFVSIIAGAVIVVLVTLLGEKFGIGTISSMVLTGVFIDVILLIDFIPKTNGLIAGILMLFAGLILLSLGSYFYIKSAFGVGPRDNLMVVLAKKTKAPVGVCRGAVEVIVTIAGWLLGGMVGIGTIISVFAIGPCIQATFRAFKFDVTALKHETVEETYKFLTKYERPH